MFGSGLRLSLFFVWFKVLGYGLRWHFHTSSSLTCKTRMPISTMVMHFFFFLLYSSFFLFLPQDASTIHARCPALTIARPCPPRTATMLTAARGTPAIAQAPRCPSPDHRAALHWSTPGPRAAPAPAATAQLPAALAGIRHRLASRRPCPDRRRPATVPPLLQLTAA
jgi:hypothetical protein